MQNIHATELREKLENGETLHIIDVREQDEYDAGHIPHVPLYPLSEFPGVTDKLAKDNVYHAIRSSTSKAACSHGTAISRRDARQSMGRHPAVNRTLFDRLYVRQTSRWR